MENMDKQSGHVCNGCGGSCGGMMHGMGGCGCHHSERNHLVKTILKLIIVIIIFSCGFRLGEMVGVVRQGYGHGMMHGDGYGMMQNYEYNTDGVAPSATITLPK